ncbi:T9SS type A sorting domain-containing protein [Chryseolinea sp. T2]|uniref:T9SS type A sorting domain-containing protein n=1 Tax=Chryseolinea sp. T2 TaxID=3129255 RepID=UPI0030778CAB
MPKLQLLLSSLLIFSVTTLRSQQLDASFHSPVALRACYVGDMIAQPDGYLLVGGEIAYHSNKPVNNLIRIASDGTLDATFVSKIPRGFIVKNLALLPSGNIAALLRTSSNIGYQSKLVVLSSNGSLMAESELLAYTVALAVLPDGRILTGNRDTGLKRFDSDLSVDDSFNVPVNGDILDIQLLGDKIYMSGTFNTVNGVTKNDIVKLNFDGTIDNSFDTGSGTNDRVGAITVLPDGKVLLGMGFINSYQGVQRRGSVRLNPDGSLDQSFAVFQGFHGPISRVNVIGDHLYITAFTYLNGKTVDQLLRFNEDGTLDETFSPVLFKSTISYDILVINSDDDLIVSGPSQLGNEYGFIKVSPDGQILSSFQPRIARHGDLKIGDRAGDHLLVAGDFIRIDSLNTYGMAKLHFDGTVDETFAIDQNYGVVEQVRLLDNGDIFVSTFQNFFKVDTNGDEIESFHWEEKPPLYQVVKFDLLKDGKVIVADPNTLARLNNDGSYDESFDLGHTSSSTAFDFDMQGDNIIYGFMGLYDEVKMRSYPIVRRVKPDGTYDPTFSNDRPELSSESDYMQLDFVKVLDNNEILAGGVFSKYAGTSVPHSLVKLSADGVFDKNFNDNQLNAAGPANFFDASAEQIGEKIYIKTPYIIYSINLDGTVNEFNIPVDVDNIASIVAIPSEDIPSGRSASAEDQLIAIGSFYNTSSGSHGSMVRLKLARTEQPQEPEEPQEPENPGEVTSVAGNYESLDVELFPNPATDRLHVRSNDNSGTFSIHVYGSTGSKIFDQSSDAGATIDLSDLPPGMYAVRVVTATGKSSVSKFIKRP